MGFDMKSLIGIVCLVLQFIVFLFIIVGTPVDVLRSKYEVGGYRSCFSMWGLKQCGNHGVNKMHAPYKGFGCAAVRNTMNAAAAFAIFSIFLTLIVLIMIAIGFFGLLKLPNVLTIIVCAIALFCITVSWACIAGAHNQKCYGGTTWMHNSFKLYGGFGLFVTSSVLELVVCILCCFA